jgi:hypothetical protein
VRRDAPTAPATVLPGAVASASALALAGEARHDGAKTSPPSAKKATSAKASRPTRQITPKKRTPRD